MLGLALTSNEVEQQVVEVATNHMVGGGTRSHFRQGGRVERLFLTGGWGYSGSARPPPPPP